MPQIWAKKHHDFENFSIHFYGIEPKHRIHTLMAMFFAELFRISFIGMINLGVKEIVLVNF